MADRVLRRLVKVGASGHAIIFTMLEANGRATLITMNQHTTRVMVLLMHKSRGTERFHVISGFETLNCTLTSSSAMKQASDHDVLVRLAHVINLFSNSTTALDHMPILVGRRFGRPLKNCTFVRWDHTHSTLAHINASLGLNLLNTFNRSVPLYHLSTLRCVHHRCHSAFRTATTSTLCPDEVSMARMHVHLRRIHVS